MKQKLIKLVLLANIAFAFRPLLHIKLLIRAYALQLTRINFLELLVEAHEYFEKSLNLTDVLVKRFLSALEFLLDNFSLYF